MPLYKRRPLIVEAHQMSVYPQEQAMLARWCHGSLRGSSVLDKGRFFPSIQILHPDGSNEDVAVGDWVVKEVDGNFYVYKAPYFELTHTLTHEPGGE